MSAVEIVLNGRRVILKAPYQGPIDDERNCIGRRDELNLILTSWIAGPGKAAFAPVLVGKPGIGKTINVLPTACLKNGSGLAFDQLFDLYQEITHVTRIRIVRTVSFV